MKDEQAVFPPGVFSISEKQADFTADWYSCHLAALQEPSLWTDRAEPD